MIIVYDYPGQLCNRIWSLLPSIAKGIEYREKVLILNFEEYSVFFDNLNKEKNVKFEPIRFLTRILLPLRARNYIHYTRKNIFDSWFDIHFTEGWATKSDNTDLIVKYSEKIRSVFDISHKVKTEVDAYLQSLDYDFIVGVHIRRGDYKEWLDGKYYYNDEIYSVCIEQLKNNLNANNELKIGFLLCSNENLDINNFPGNCFVLPNSSGIKDLYALSRCRYIIGPPSTFSQWASFYGNVPLKFILSPSDKMETSSFSKIIALDRFENGNELHV